MLTLHENARISRRQLLSIGSLALGGLSLSSLLAAKASGATGSANDKSVIFIFQQGGPPQFETYDPKPNAPSDIRTVTGITQTTIPGVQFGDTLGRLARHADKLTIVRSFQTDNGGHNIRPLVGPESLNTNIGAIAARVLGSTHPTTGMPRNALLLPQSVCSDVAAGQGRGDLSATPAVGSNYAPFTPGGPGPLMRDLRLNLAPDHFADRRALLEQMDALSRQLGRDTQVQSADQYQRQAAEVLLSGRVAEALDLSREDPRLVSAYDTARYVASHNWSQVARGRQGMYTGQAKSLGKSLLLARRLCEAGCAFVTVHADYAGVWDFHADGNNLNVADGMEAVGRSFDHAVAAFIDDIEARGLQDRIMLVACGEMGRTPRINPRGGRDHWGKLAPLLIYGGNAARGRVVGQSTRDGGEPSGTPYNGRHLISTILHHLWDVPQVRLQPAFASVYRLAEVNPIPIG
ncbi:MAG: DUF1501 domain-containing protein [Planctomycetes bacterium]|nr:DUF1501 domain-containing protein [Planctomycetota bacterium]